MTHHRADKPAVLRDHLQIVAVGAERYGIGRERLVRRVGRVVKKIEVVAISLALGTDMQRGIAREIRGVGALRCQQREHFRLELGERHESRRSLNDGRRDHALEPRGRAPRLASAVLAKAFGDPLYVLAPMTKSGFAHQKQVT